MLRIRANFYGNPTRNKKVREEDIHCPNAQKHVLIQSLLFLRKISFLILTNKNKTLRVILTNQSEELCIKIKESSGTSLESLF